MINFAVIGRNFVVDSFLEAAREREDVCLLGVYSRNAQTALDFAKKHGAKRTYTSLEALALDPDIDFVYVASPNICHESQVITLLHGGKHVLCEKPCAPDAAGFLRMLSVARQEKRVLMEAMMPTHMPAMEAVRQFLPRIAPVRLADFTYCQYSSRYDKFKNGIIENAFDPTLGNGALMDIGIYPVQMLTNLFGTPESVDGFCTFLPDSIDGAGTILAKYPGFLAKITYSKISDGNLACEIQGEGGRIEIDRASRPRTVRLILRDGSVETFETEGNHSDMYYELSDFLDAMKKGNADTFCALTEKALLLTDLARAKMGVNFQKYKA